MGERRRQKMVEREVKLCVAQEQLRDRERAEARAAWESSRFADGGKEVQRRERERAQEVAAKRAADLHAARVVSRRAKLCELYAEERAAWQRELRQHGLARCDAY